MKRVLAEPLTGDDVVGAYAGLRPLVLPASAGSGPGDATAGLSREHLLHWDGLVLTVVGGELTTYRAMAAGAVDQVEARLGGARRGAAGGRPAGDMGELRFAVRAEGAWTVADLVDRRTRIGLVPADRAAAVPVAEAVRAADLRSVSQ